ncbi:MAG: class I SAM-dependent methyltransferase [Anaerolineae bacterium]|nr:class I SAM-dependent methyltransferase [Anaerolineae bacterium]
MTHREFFDQSAAQWDAWENEETRARLRDIITALNIAPEADVLDVGCGTGILFPLLPQATNDKGHLVGLDISGEMLVRAQSKGYRVMCVQGDAQDLPLVAQSFDWIICNAVLPHFPDKLRALRELARALREGGTLVICHANSRQTINEIHRSVGGVIANDTIPDVNEMRALLEQAHLAPLEMQDAPDRYVVVARKMTKDE